MVRDFKTLLVVLFVTAAGCSLINTDDLTGGLPTGVASDGGLCTGASCADAAMSSCGGANVQTDNKNCGACGKVCAAGTSCAKGACVTGCAGGIVYVSQVSGSDSFDGCTSDTPKLTISAAISAAAASSATSREVHVCAGTYAESALTLNDPIALKGGYDCVSWARSATYGYPKFDGLDLTTVQASASNVSGVTLSVSGVGITPATVIDGFRILGPARTVGNIDSYPVQLAYASPTVSNNQLIGAPQSASTTHGIDVNFISSPLIIHNKIDGGGGDGSAQALTVEKNSSPTIEDNTILTQNSAAQTEGIILSADDAMVDATAIRGNTIQPGSGTGLGSNPGSFGILDKSTTSVIVGNIIESGAATCTASVPVCSTFGLALYSTDGVGRTQTVVGNRIIALGGAGGQQQIARGVDIQGPESVTLINNAIQVTNAGTATSIGIGVSLRTGVAIAQHNTIFAATRAFDLDAASTVSGDNNLLLGNGAVTFQCLLDNSCPRTVSPAVADFRGNALVAFGASIALSIDGPNANDCTNNNIVTLADLTTAYPVASNNVRLLDTCSEGTADGCHVDSACPANATDGAACIQTVLASWDSASQGRADLLDSTRTWKLGTNVPCVISQGGVDLSSQSDGGPDSIAFDINGAPRTAPVSIGAYEYDGTCQLAHLDRSRARSREREPRGGSRLLLRPSTCRPRRQCQNGRRLRRRRSSPPKLLRMQIGERGVVDLERFDVHGEP